MGELVKSTLLEIAGIACIVAGLFFVWPPLALLGAGSAMVFVGYNTGAN